MPPTYVSRLRASAVAAGVFGRVLRSTCYRSTDTLAWLGARCRRRRAPHCASPRSASLTSHVASEPRDRSLHRIA
ncbi:unnamed protein product, partial [Iphiclides podalirius]